MTARTAPPASTASAARLLAGWRRTGRPAGLWEHLRTHGPMPLRGSGRGSPLASMVGDAGLTGRGGAGFPTGVKMRAVAQRRGPAVVVANAMEGEPASEKDQVLLSVAPHLVLDGLMLAADAVGAREAHVCLPDSRPWLAEAMAAALGERAEAGIDPLPAQVHMLPHRYVASEETALVNWLSGGEATPRGSSPRPAERGVGRRPTLIDNVETLAHVALIARYGPSWFRRAGRPGAPGTMLVTVSGAVTAPGVYEIELGTRLGDVLALASPAGPAGPMGGLLVGGYSGSWLDPRTALDLPVTAQGLRGAGASIGAGVLVVLPVSACGLNETARVLAYLAAESAGQCGPCTYGLPAIADDFAELMAGRSRAAALDRLERRLEVIAGRGACALPDGAVRLAASALSAFPADLHAHARHQDCQAARYGGPARAVLPVPRPQSRRVTVT